MAPPIAAAEMISPDLNPYVGEIANRLLNSFRDDGTPMTSDGWALIEQVLSYAADAEQRIAAQTHRIAHLESLSATDELTGLANRRGFEQALVRVLAAARRYDESGVIGFIDLDHFKRINDELGHEAGDLALRHVAELLEGNLRRADVVARLGGDEFLVLLVRTDLANGTRRVRILQGMLAASRITYHGHPIPLRASAGVVAYDGDSKAAELIRTADLAMYEEKRRTHLRLLSLDVVT